MGIVVSVQLLIGKHSNLTRNFLKNIRIIILDRDIGV